MSATGGLDPRRSIRRVSIIITSRRSSRSYRGTGRGRRGKGFAKGRVVQAGWEPGYGNTVTIDHGYGIVTKFAHASRILARVGARVERGERIALVGNTGLSSGPHLHYEVHVNGRPVDPRRYILPGVVTD